MAWTPDPEAVSQLAQLLVATLNPRDKAKQKSAELTIKQIQADPSFEKYLVYFLAVPSSADALPATDASVARTSAGLMLKNRVKTSWKTISEANKDYLKGHILEGFKDKSNVVRNNVGLVITEVLRQGGGILAWPQVLMELISLVDWTAGSTDPDTQAGAMAALLIICEDHKKSLDKDYHGSRPMDALVPQLIQFSSSPNPNVRWRALSALHSFMEDKPPEAVQVNAESILHCLTLRANDENEQVKRFVCRLFTSLTAMIPELMLPHFDSVIDYILQQIQADPESDLALDAADFFFENTEVKELYDAFGSVLSKVVPVLLESMRYSTEAQERLQAEAEEDAEAADREQDIKPQFATTKTEKGAAPKKDGQQDSGYAYEDDDSEGEIDEDDEDNDPEEEWSLRKCSAASLDVFSAQYNDKIFEITLPYLRDNLNSPEWANREAAVLALGAISTGCMESVMPSLPELVPYLLSLLNDSSPVVRQITCWTLGRYSSWAAQLDESGKKAFFEPIMEGLLKHMLDKNKKVQKAAISAFASLEDGAKESIIPYGPTIARQFAACFEHFQSQNMYLLYDCVETLADSMGSAMANPDMIDTLMPSIITRWHLVDDNSKEMIPLLECLAYLATSMGEAFAPFAEPLFGRCTKIIQDHLEISQVILDQDKDFLVTSLDLLSAIIQALQGAQSEALVKAARPNVFEILSHCMRDDSHDVRQSAYALLGDCAIYVFGQLRPYISPLMQILLMQLDLDVATTDKSAWQRIVNNACWSGGEIAMRAGQDIAPFLDQLLQKLGAILFREKIQASLNENAAIAIGRLGFHNAQSMATHLPQLAPTFLNRLQTVDWTDEKRDALQGLTNMVAINPQGLEQCLPLYLAEVANGMLNNFAPPHGFQEILANYKTMIPDFATFLEHLPLEQRQALQQAFQA